MQVTLLTEISRHSFLVLSHPSSVQHYLHLGTPRNRNLHSLAMPNWRDEYLSSIKDVELNNPVNMELVQSCP